MPNFSARQRRIYRARSAAYLATLDATCSVDELLTLDWASIETLPHWCFLDDKQKRDLLLLAGALFLAPMIQRWIDGKRIQSLLELTGNDVYQHLLTYRTAANAPDATLATDAMAESLAENEAPDTAQMLFNAGTAVLLGAIQHPVIARLLHGQCIAFLQSVSTDSADTPAPLPPAIAQPLYQDALVLFDRLYPANLEPANLEPTSLDPASLDPTSLDPTSLDPTSEAPA